jgi:hypothetical protein
LRQRIAQLIHFPCFPQNKRQNVLASFRHYTYDGFVNGRLPTQKGINMERLHATPEGAGYISPSPAFRSILANVVTPTTRAHERREAKQNTAYAGLWRNIVRRAVSRAHCGIDVPDMATYTRAVY